MAATTTGSAPVYPDTVALGPWQNEDTFWKALVERKKLPHLGHPFGSSPVRDSLALGPIVFADAPAPEENWNGYLDWIEQRTKEYLKGDHLRRIAFDITGIEGLTGRLGDGYFAIREFAFVLADDDLFRKTWWYRNGRRIRMAREPLRIYLRNLRTS